MTRKEQIKSAYKLTGSNASFYDGMMTYFTPSRTKQPLTGKRTVY